MQRNFHGAENALLNDLTVLLVVSKRVCNVNELNLILLYLQLRNTKNNKQKQFLRDARHH
jgi:hypothetical protein